MAATEKQDDIERQKLIARGRLKDAKKWFAIKGWNDLSQDHRGRQILKWGADHAWLAAETNWERPRSVRRWCKSKAPSLTDAELDELVEYTRTSNKRWSNDQSATVLGIGVRDSQKHSFKFLGADDDPNYEIRTAVKLEKDAARKRRSRADRGAVPREVYEANSLSRTMPWKSEGISRSTWERRRKKAAAQAAANDASASASLSNIDGRTDLRHGVDQTSDSPAPRAPGRLAPIIIDIVDSLDDGDALMAPPPMHVAQQTVH